MSYELRVVRDGATHLIESPWIKIGGVWTYANTVYRKEAGVWVEWWPLMPSPPTDIVLEFSYLNDRIEMDLTWKPAPSGTPAASYRIEISVPRSEHRLYETAGLSLHPDKGYQQSAGERAYATIVPVSAAGVRGWSAQVFAQVAQLPPPPAPTSVVLSIERLVGTLSWAHVGGNRLGYDLLPNPNDSRTHAFELRTSYKTQTQDIVANRDERSKVVSFWPPMQAEGDPGGPVGSMVRAVGPGGVSDWATTTGTIPNAPNRPPPVTVQVPGAAKITHHRFLNGVLRCDYSCSNASAAKAWWQKNNEDWVSLGNVSASGSISVAGSNNWPADQLNGYRIIIQGTNSGGAGTAVGGQRCIKVPNPYYILPVDTIAIRHDAPYNDSLMRQGGSYNQYNYRDPIIRWKSYAVYGNHIKTALTSGRLGYDITVSKGEILLWRKNSGGSGQAVRPRIWYHTYVNPGDVPHAVWPTLYNGHDLAAFNRDEAKWQTLDLGYVRGMVGDDPGACRGVAIYHPNTALLSYLGEVSAEYILMHDHGTAIYGIPMWSLLIHHDG